MDPVNAKNATDLFGESPGIVIHFTFYVDDKEDDVITPFDAYNLQFQMIAWLREKGYGFDGGAHLFSTWAEEDDYHKAAAHG